MTDDLVKRLLSEGRLDEYYEVPAIQKEAADALEAQAKRIEELEIRVEYYEKTRELALKVADERYDRIAGLDAALDDLSKAFIEEMIGAGWIMRDIKKIPAFRRARATLEKSDDN